jgi:hypothetical protein
MAIVREPLQATDEEMNRLWKEYQKAIAMRLNPPSTHSQTRPAAAPSSHPKGSVNTATAAGPP